MIRCFLAFLESCLLLTLVSAAIAQERVNVPVAIVAYPDLVLYNGKVVTMDDRSQGPSSGHIYQAIAIRDRRIEALGTDAEILSYAGPKTQKIDLGGKTAVPGFVDSHTHIHNNEADWWVKEHPEAKEALGKYFVVQGNTDEELKKSIAVILKEQMNGMSPDKWAFITLPNGGSTGEGIGVKFLQKRQITGKDLDTLSPNHPVFLMSHPSYMMNSSARKAIAKLYGNPPTEDRIDDTGFGNLTEYVRTLPVDSYFEKRTKELADLLEQGLRKNAAVGITAFASHLEGLQFMNAYQMLVREDRMPIRFAFTHYFGFQANPDPASFYQRFGDFAGMGTEYFWLIATGLGAVDSGPPAFCSTMEAPKAIKDQEWCRNSPGTILNKAVFAAILSKQRVAVGHAYADKAVDYFMDALEEAMKVNPEITLDYIRSRRFTSDHCGFYPRPDQIPRMARLGMMISCGGNVLTRSYPWLKVYGKQHINRISPVHSLLKGGVTTVYENEAGVNGNTAGTYFLQGYALITRQTDNGDLVVPEESIDRMTLMKMSTSWPSEYVLREKEIGTLEAGKLADLLVLNKDYFTVPEEEIPTIYPLMTVVGGKIIVLRNEWAKELGKPAIGPQLQFFTKPRVTPPGGRAAARED